jgi:carbamoyl-phosphate synthase/aspartate carbamoyltransferase/dihydroorotase
VHAEGTNTAAAIGLAAVHRRSVHVAHVSTADEIRVIRAAKEAGLDVTCEVAPHHLYLTEDDARALGGRGEVRPRLARQADVDALWANLDVVDCIATDHAPHLPSEKDSQSPPPGFPGLETAASLMLTAVQDGRLSLDRLVELMSKWPARRFGVPTADLSELEIDTGAEWVIPEDGFFTKCDWSPFAGQRVVGRVLKTRLRGADAFADGTVLAPPGSGRFITSVNPG